MVCKDTLRIKHLPKELTDVQKEDFVKHFGALKVKILTSKAKEKSVVYAKFENEEIAKNVLLRLHQVTVLNCRLCVDYAETDILQGVLTAKSVEDVGSKPDQKLLKNFIKNINAFNDTVGFYQPPPAHLKYNYPKANRPTINNIAHALATVPRFYIQVLHLMNRMNLPPPFAMPDPPVRTIPSVVHPKPTLSEEKKKESSSESEMESDGESNKNKEIIPEKRKLPQKKMVVKRPRFIKQQPSSNVITRITETLENVFEKVDVHPQRKIEMKVVSQKQETPPLETTKPEFESTKIIIQNEKKIPMEPKVATTQTKAQKKHFDVIEPKSIGKQEVENAEKVTIVQKDAEANQTSPLKEKEVPNFQQSSIAEIDTPKKLLHPSVGIEPSLENQEKKSTPENEKPPQRVEIQQKEDVVETLMQQEKTMDASEPLQEPTSPDDEYPCISLEELAANQVTDLSVMPVFKNYNPGEPTNKLYIKNCAKSVVTQDLEYIYNRYREEGTVDKPSEFNIRLMQEGRMKGQAFVTLDSVEMAQKAVKETNGFILKDRPLVVVFGKAGKKK